MSVDRTLHRRSPGAVTFGGVTLHARSDINGRHDPVWDDVTSSLHGIVDKVKKDLVIKNTFRLWGAWENLTVLFPSALMTPVPGTSLMSDAAMVVKGRNTDVITYHNTAITKVSDLYLGIDNDIFAADIEFTSIVKSGVNPEDAAAYYTLSTAAFADTTFAKTNYKRQRYSCVWGAVGGFTALEFHKGINLAWDCDVQPEYSANYGTTDLYVGEGGVRAAIRGIPLQPTMAQIEAASRGALLPMGTLLSSNAADFTITGSGVSIVGKNMGLVGHGYMWGATPLRNGEIVFGTTTGFTTGTRAATATVS